MVNLSKATPTQKEEFYKLAEQYCTKERIDYSFTDDQELKRICRAIQIKAIQDRAGSWDDEGMAHHVLGNLYRQGGQFAAVSRNGCFAVC